MSAAAVAVRAARRRTTWRLPWGKDAHGCSLLPLPCCRILARAGGPREACGVVEPSAAHCLGHDRQVPDFRLRIPLLALAMMQVPGEHLLRLGGEVSLPGLRCL